MKLSNKLKLEILANYDYIKRILPTERQVTIIFLVKQNSVRTSADLANQLGISIPNASTQLQVLVNKGWLERQDTIAKSGGINYTYYYRGVDE